MEDENEKKEEKKNLSKPMKKKGEHRVHILKVYLNDKEIEEIENVASIYGRSKSIILRETFFKTFGKTPTGKGKHQPDVALVRAVSRVGVNLNQVAKAINTVAKAKDFLEVQAVHSDIEKMRGMLEEILEESRKNRRQAKEVDYASQI